MMTDDPHPWLPGWEYRVVEMAKRLGLHSVSELLEQMPAHPYRDVAERLGPRVPPIQVIVAQFKEAVASNSVRAAARDSLCRHINEEFPQGWGLGDDPDWQADLALTMWTKDIVVTADLEELEGRLAKIGDTLCGFPPPTGWRPSGPTDPLINRAFDACWPATD